MYRHCIYIYLFLFRIRSLERNVSLSTGFLEELSLKYIKQIDELNSATKVGLQDMLHLSESLLPSLTD